MEEVTAYIGFGSNLGDRRENIDRAVTMLSIFPGVSIKTVSKILETEPVGMKNQPMFLNCVAEASTTLEPRDLLNACLSIEKRLGRVRRERWGPRIIDLDILFYGTQTIHEPGLTIPHPEISNRPFVQAGLQELGAYSRVATHG